MFLWLRFLICSIGVYVRGNWEISRRDLNSTHLVSMVPSDQSLNNSNYDPYSVSSSGSLICCRSVAIIVIPLAPFLCPFLCIHVPYTFWLCFFSIFISSPVQFMVLLILRHTLPLLISGSKDFYFPLFMVRFA